MSIFREHAEMQMPDLTLSRPSTFANVEHYFSWCALQQRYFIDRVNRNPKTAAVNSKLAAWHRENPDKAVVNIAEWRIARARKRAS